MEAITINQSNWSGKTATIYVDRDKGALKVYDEVFRVEETQDTDLEGEVFMKVMKAYPQGEEEYPICGAFRYKGVKGWDTYWEAYDDVGNPYITREDKDPYVAMAQVLFNLI